MYTKVSLAFIVLLVIVGISYCDDDKPKAKRFKARAMGKMGVSKAKCTENVDKIKTCLDQTKLSTVTCADPFVDFKKTLSECISDKNTTITCLKTAGVLTPPKGGKKGGKGRKGRKGKKSGDDSDSDDD